MEEKYIEKEYLNSQLNLYLKNDKFYKYYQFLVSENQKYNLTRITEINAVYYKHFYDSIYLSTELNLDNKSILDVGSGAGFPSVPLRIINPTIQISIVDGTKKRIDFLEALIEQLDLDNVKLIYGRAEEMDKSHHFDIVTARAVAKLNILVEITLPFVKVGGYFVAFKSVNFETELKEANAGIEKLGGKVFKTIKYSVSEDEEHILIIIKKIKPTPEKFPRHFSKIKKSPL